MLLFNEGKPGTYEYEPGKVIGVNDPIGGITITLKKGYWYLGDLQSPSAN